jgi:hypothetical protein
MNRILLLILIGGITFLIILFKSRPDLLNDFWLWAVGLAAPLIRITDLIIQKLKAAFTRLTSRGKQSEQEAAYHAARTKNIDESVS